MLQIRKARQSLWLCLIISFNHISIYNPTRQHQMMNCAHLTILQLLKENVPSRSSSLSPYELSHLLRPTSERLHIRLHICILDRHSAVQLAVNAITHGLQQQQWFSGSRRFCINCISSRCTLEGCWELMHQSYEGVSIDCRRYWRRKCIKWCITNKCVHMEIILWKVMNELIPRGQQSIIHYSSHCTPSFTIKDNT